MHKKLTEFSTLAANGVSISLAAMKPSWAISIHGEGNTLLAKVKTDGTVEYGPTYSPDATARAFWEGLAGRSPFAETERLHREVEALKVELQVTRGVADSWKAASDHAENVITELRERLAKHE